MIAVNKVCCFSGALFALAMSGCVSSVRQLKIGEEHRSLPSYAANKCSDTKLITVDMSDKDVAIATVMEPNIFGDSVPVGNFDVGEIVWREFDRFATRNFAPPTSDQSTAKLSYKITSVSLKKKSDVVTAEIGIGVSVDRVGEQGKNAYSKSFMSEPMQMPWLDKSSVPEAFYIALDNVINKFIQDWGSDRAVYTLKRWDSDDKKWADARKGPQELSAAELYVNSIKIVPTTNGVFYGICNISNDIFDAKTPTRARAIVYTNCVAHLGVNPEQVCVSYEKQKFKGALYELEFYTYVRPRTPVIIKWDEVVDPSNKRKRIEGAMIADLESVKGKTTQQFKVEMLNLINAQVRNAKGTTDGHAQFDKPEKIDNFGIITMPFWFYL